eukprot:Gb_38754 [translate_table: standard]
MSSRASTYWRRLLSRYQEARPFSTSTQMKMKLNATEQFGSNAGTAAGSLRLLKPDFFPIYTLLGMTLMALFMGTLTIKQELMHCPNVLVDKKKRKSLPELKDPDFVLKKSDDFVNKSFFRRVGENTAKDSELGRAMPWLGARDTSQKQAETLKSVGVEI